MGHLVGFPVTLGGFKIDGEGKDGLFRYSHQIGALLFGLLAAGVQLPAVGVIGKGGDHFNELVDQFGSKTGTVHIDLLREKIVDRFHVRRNRLRFGRRGEGFQLLLQVCNLVICLFAEGLIFFSWQFAVCTHSSVVQLALFNFFDLASNRSSRHSCSSFSVLAAFDHLASTENGFILIAPDLFKYLLRHQFQLPLRDRNGITTELLGHVVIQNEGTGRVDGSHIALVAKDRRSVLQFTPVENAVGRTAAAAKF